MASEDLEYSSRHMNHFYCISAFHFFVVLKIQAMFIITAWEKLLIFCYIEKKKSYSLERHEGNYIKIHFSSFFLYDTC